MDRLVDALWPGGDAPEGANRSLLTYVSRLRAALGGAGIVTRRSGYALELGDDTCDIDEFDALVDEGDRALPERAPECYDAALALWRGAAFGEYTDEWWAVAAARLAERRIGAREERARALIVVGEPHRGVPDLEALVAEHPLRERPLSLLMQALQATGRSAEALRAFVGFRRRLADETGMDPTADLVALERSIAANVEPVARGVLGRPLRGYVIHEAIGEGASGRVYAATQPGVNRRVAIKVIRPDVADSVSFVQRFEVEAQLVARLEHPHIVPLYDFWREPGAAFLVSRLLSGGSARESVVAGGAWSLTRVSRLVEEVGAALMTAHASGVTHNDLTASNVLLDGDGVAYLTDFGIALDLGDGADADAAIADDVRAMAWLVWELLVVDRPTRRSATLPPASGSLRRAGLGPPPSLVGRATMVPDGLDAVLARAAKKTDGYSSVAEFVIAWRAAVGRPDGVLSPLRSDERAATDSSRQGAAGRLARTAAAGVNPFKGLRPFDEGDAGTFLGREDVVDAIVESIAGRRFVTIVGASGSGKSSVVRAGLAPRLRAAGRTVVTMLPGEHPMGALAAALRDVSTSETPAGDALAVIAAIGAENGPVTLVVDQFEECWTRCPSDRRDEFLDVLTFAVDGEDTGTRVVSTVRADLLERPLQDPRVGHLVGEGAFVLAPMSPAQLDAAITIPAARASVTFDDRVVVDLVAGTVSQPGGLALLQFTLTELFDRRIDGHVDADALTAAGGISGSIARRADAALDELDEPTEAGARELSPGCSSPAPRASPTPAAGRVARSSRQRRSTLPTRSSALASW